PVHGDKLHFTVGKGGDDSPQQIFHRLFVDCQVVVFKINHPVALAVALFDFGEDIGATAAAVAVAEGCMHRAKGAAVGATAGGNHKRHRLFFEQIGSQFEIV